MKNIAAIISLVLLVSSCRKDRVCECTRKNNPEDKDVYQLSISKKGDANESCQSYYAKYETYYEECKLK